MDLGNYIQLHFDSHAVILFIPFVMFWVLLFVGRSELSLQAILICIGIWLFLVLTAGIFMMIGTSGGMVFCILAGLQAVFDMILILMTFGGDIRLN